MKLHIHDNLTIEDLQDRFSKCFPGLKIEFYTKNHRCQKPSNKDCIIDRKARVGEIRKIHNNGELEIKSWDTTGKIEFDLKRLFGLDVQIFRNENGAWIQTSSTDPYSLKQQIEFSQFAKSSIFPKVEEQLNEYEYL